MAEEGKLKIERFDGTNFGFWKMQIDDYLNQKDLYLPMEGKTKKPKEMNDDEWVIHDRKVLGTIRQSLTRSVVFNIQKENTTLNLMDALAKLYKKDFCIKQSFVRLEDGRGRKRERTCKPVKLINRIVRVDRHQF